VTYLDLTCRVCELAALDEIVEFRHLPRVTSDCKPFAPGGRLAVCAACGAVQKPTDAVWQSEAQSIYAAYDVYYQSGGVEQAVFDPVSGAPRRRSAVIVDQFVASHTVPTEGKALDVGCGNGALLRAFGEARPVWNLYGHDLNEINLAALKQIRGFRSLFVGRVGVVPGRFDLITLIHSLEHFANPIEALMDIRAKLALGGSLLVETPDAGVNPIDLVVADHAMHFLRHDLARLLVRTGYDPGVIASDWVVKELSAVAHPAPDGVILKTADLTGSRPDAARRFVQSQVRWLQAVLDDARTVATEAHDFGIFGSSIAAVWLFGHLRDEVSFFVDEDLSRRNAELFGHPILSPQDVPAGSTVFVPLIPRVAQAVVARLSGQGLKFRRAPEWSAPL
jgi:SAM-dependent methyltransferase